MEGKSKAGTHFEKKNILWSSKPWERKHHYGGLRLHVDCVPVSSLSHGKQTNLTKTTGKVAEIKMIDKHEKSL